MAYLTWQGTQGMVMRVSIFEGHDPACFMMQGASSSGASSGVSPADLGLGVIYDPVAYCRGLNVDPQVSTTTVTVLAVHLPFLILHSRCSVRGGNAYWQTGQTAG